MNYLGRPMRTLSLSILAGLVGCTGLPATVQHDPSLPFLELDGYKFHVRTLGDKNLPPLIVVHGGPGGDSKYLYPLQDLAKSNYVIFYDQRGTGLSPRVDRATLTLDSSLEDLHLMVNHFGQGQPVRLIGHSWGAMLATGYLSRYPERVSHAVLVEPGILNAASAHEFVRRLKASQSIADALPLLKFMLQSLFVITLDGHERFDYVMTRLMNQSKPGGPYQCAGQAMPDDAFARAGYDSFANMLKPLLDRPDRFDRDLAHGISAFKGKLLMLSSECSFIGYEFQQEFHTAYMPAQMIHVQAMGMGHNMLTLNPDWSVDLISSFFNQSDLDRFVRSGSYGAK
jgi:proline iminopeptidase